jgi:hypothetical protein
MTEGPDSPPERGMWEGLPVAQPSTNVPWWAVPAVVVGVACSLVAGWISFQYFAGRSPGLALAYTMPLIPLLVVGVPAMLFGALGVARPRTARRPLLRLVILVGVIAWWYVVLEGPELLV